MARTQSDLQMITHAKGLCSYVMTILSSNDELIREVCVCLRSFSLR